jgi:hypothetical protein
MLTTRSVGIAVVGGGLMLITGSLAPPVAVAEPYGNTAAEQQYLAEADQYLLRPRPTDKVVLELGYRACSVRRIGGSSDDAKVAIWNAWDTYGMRPAAGAEVGSLVHVAVDNLCPEVGYP